MRDELIALAKEAGAELYADTICVNGKDADDFVTRFSTLVAAKEREACALVCEEVRKDGDDFKPHEDNHDDGHTDGCNNCASAIRARKP